MTEQPMVTATTLSTNLIGLTKADYKGSPSTLCQGCGHNSIANQIVAACYEMNIVPENVMKFSGIGCSSKSPNYFLNRAFGFNGLHGRMPSMAIGAMFADITMKPIGVSGDGDTASIGLSQFKHLMRRNAPMVYICENNGVYGLTKGQFSATAEIGLSLKKQGTNFYMPVDICMEALASNATFVARSFAGDPKQVKELIKAAFSHRGIAVLDIISPCITFGNIEGSLHSYTWGKDNEMPLHELSYVPPRDEIMVEDFVEGTTREVCLHDGSMILLKKLAQDYDPTDRSQAFHILEEAQRNNWLVTGLIHVNPNLRSMLDLYELPDTPLNRLSVDRIRPTSGTLDKINSEMI
jgi:2-oxoglutarate/2-oxoacid ferredoxin oxidoreductase subunit beta